MQGALCPGFPRGFPWLYDDVLCCMVVRLSDDGCEELKFTRLMDSHVCYDLIPYTSKLVVFDTQLTVNNYIDALTLHHVADSRVEPMQFSSRVMRFSAKCVFFSV